MNRIDPFVPPVAENSDSGRIAAQFTTYIQKAVISAKLDYLRHKARLESREEPTDPLPEQAGAPDDLFQEVLGLEQISPDALELIAAGESLYHALQNLPAVKKAVLFYLIVEERSTKETAEILKKSPDWIRKLKRAALIELREQLEGERKNDV
ncbi:RNA polymerase sigma factor [Anaerotruncus rubiinfantis]|uniref:RNA polymerase sigma factor n=1 Tax=Anaerotruncus rubiinfantis TaxID=1720200 RepID=UPI0034A22A7F